MKIYVKNREIHAKIVLERTKFLKEIMKFICDQMLIRLGRWLRAAGYDVEIIEKSLPDNEILQRALDQNRLLLTRDRHFLKTASKNVIWLQANALEDCICELTQKIAIDWLMNPFSRCTLCNQNLEEIITHDSRIPANVKGQFNRYWICPSCKRIYWEGSHTQSMKLKLSCWQHYR